MSDKKKIMFTRDVRVLDHKKEVEFQASSGEVVELSVSSANRWLRRNVATVDIQGSQQKIMKEKVAEIKESAPAKKAAPRKKPVQKPVEESSGGTTETNVEG